MLRNIKTVNHIKVKASWCVAFMDIRNICQPTQKIHDKQETEYDFDK